jgi:hypothetical protein
MMQHYNSNVKRIRISLRLMLLLTAFCAVLFAWLGARRELNRINADGDLHRIELYRDYTVKSGPQNHTSEEAWRSHLAELDAEIAKRQAEIGHSVP